MKLSQMAVSAAHRVLIFGPPKSGKTRLAGMLAQYFNLLYFNLENGLVTLLQLPKEWQERIEVVSIPDTRSYPMAIETMLKVVKGGAGNICEAHGKWNCVVCKTDSAPVIPIHLNALPLDTIVIVDSLTQLTNSAIAHITRAKPEDYKLEWDDWYTLGKLMDMFLSHIQQAPYNVICISHETEVEMEDGKDKLVPTAGTRNFSRNTARYFDDVIYAEVKNKKHVAASSSTYSGTILTGSRSGVVTETAPEASLLAIFKGEKTPVNSPIQSTPSHKSAADLSALAAQMRAEKEGKK